MTFLQRLRQARTITRLILVWFALSLGAAIASPAVNPQALELICASNGVMKVLVKNADGSSTEETRRMLDCPMCAPVVAPPPVTTTSLQAAQPLGSVLQTSPATHIAATTAAPPPARGPPALA